MSELLRKIALIMLFVAVSDAVYALDLPLRNVNGVDYYYYEVKQGETIFSITHKLGISRDDIIKYNPSVADGLKANSVLYFPASEYGSSIGGSTATTMHTVKRGETLFGISRQYNVNPEAIVAMNPGCNEGVRAGQVIKIPGGTVHDSGTADIAPAISGESPSEDVEQDVLEGDTYVVKAGDTFYSIAKAAGMSVDMLTDLNPFVDQEHMSIGTVLRLNENAPVVLSDQDAELRPVVVNPIKIVPQEDVMETGDDEESAYNNDYDGDLSVVVLLPFMLTEENPSKQAMLYTDFYKGFLIAADTLKNHAGSPVRIIAIDTRDDLQRLSDVLDRPDVKSASVIIAPEDDRQLNMVADFANENGIYLFNVFGIKNDTYKHNPYVIQGNINQQLMYDKAIDAVFNEYPDHTPVILWNEAGKNEKAAFVNALKSICDNAGRKYVEITFSGMFDASDLEMADDSKYVFIPASGAMADFNKIAPAIKALKDSSVDTDRIKLFGYPDWTAFRGEALEMLHKTDAVVYSRFFYDPIALDTRNMSSAFRRWYGKPMMEVVPNQGLLGFDSGCFLIRALRRNRGDFAGDLPSYGGYKGSQSTFRFTSPSGDGEGMVNDALYLIRFNPDNEITTKIL